MEEFIFCKKKRLEEVNEAYRRLKGAKFKKLKRQKSGLLNEINYPNNEKDHSHKEFISLHLIYIFLKKRKWLMI